LLPHLRIQKHFVLSWFCVKWKVALPFAIWLLVPNRARNSPSTLAFSLSVLNNGAMLTRNNLRLTLAGGRAILAAAEKKAREIKVPMNIAVVDEGGHLLVFARMDGVKLSSIEVALTKAMSAALRRTPSGPSPTSGEPSVVLSLGLSLATDGKLTAIRGGLPLIKDGQHLGGIGVSGGSEDEDVQVAQAGVDALEKFS
jgi:glc operon protein GlcG